VEAFQEVVPPGGVSPKPNKFKGPGKVSVIMTLVTDPPVMLRVIV
jgi:hypothetical protein